jgi:hypothetical protein
MRRRIGISCRTSLPSNEFRHAPALSEATKIEALSTPTPSRLADPPPKEMPVLLVLIAISSEESSSHESN